MANQDPLQSFLDYIQDVKPYHTKVYEVTLAYTASDVINATVKDSWNITIGMYSAGTVLPGGAVVGGLTGGNINVCEGVGWDTDPWDEGMWDFPYICDLGDPNRVNVTVLETFLMHVTHMSMDSAITIVFDTSNGWDLHPWDSTPWDLELGPDMTTTDTAIDAGATTITETFKITVQEVTP